MRPAELRPALVILQMGAEAVATQDAPEHRSQRANQHFAPARGRHREYGVSRRDEHPWKPLAAVGPPTSLAGVDHRLIL